MRSARENPEQPFDPGYNRNYSSWVDPADMAEAFDYEKCPHCELDAVFRGECQECGARQQ